MEYNTDGLKGDEPYIILYLLNFMSVHILINNPFPHTTILQQTNWNIFCQKIENLYKWMDNLWLTVENIVAEGEIAGLSNFFFCHDVFKKLSAAEAS